MERFYHLNSDLISRIADDYAQRVQRKIQENQDSSDDYFRDYFLKYENPMLEQLKQLDAKKLTSVAEIAFGSSLSKEEDRFHQFSLILCPPPATELLEDLYLFDEWPDLELLPKLSASIEKTSQFLFAWFEEDQTPKIWGFGNDVLGHLCISVSSISPGQIVVKTPSVSPGGATQTNFVGGVERTGFIDNTDAFAELFHQSEDFTILRQIIETAHGGEDGAGSADERIATFKQLLMRMDSIEYLRTISQRMNEHAHGGALLILSNIEKLGQSVIFPYLLNQKISSPR